MVGIGVQGFRLSLANSVKFFTLLSPIVSDEMKALENQHLFGKLKSSIVLRCIGSSAVSRRHQDFYIFQRDQKPRS